MPIKSYLIYPCQGQKQQLIKELSVLGNCEVIPAENKDVIVLITETENEIEENSLKEKVEDFDSLKLMSLVSGFNTPKKE